MNYGKINYWFTRVTTMANRFIQPANFLMLLFLTAQEQPLALLLLPVGIIAAGLWIWFDHHNVLESELDYQYNRIPTIRQISTDVKEIRRQLDGHS